MNSLENINKKYSNDLYLAFFVKKVEKIISALYLVTENFNHNEPLKWDIRKKGLKLLSEVVKLNNDRSPNRMKIFSQFSFSFFEIMSFLELSVVIKLLSEENLEVLKREFNLLLTLIENYSINGKSHFSTSINNDHFKIQDKYLRSKEIKKVLRNIKDISNYKGHYNNKGHKVLKYGKTKVNNVSNDQKKLTRRDSIVKILSKGQKLTIKDISKVITDCSEKTIQRELQSMMKDNLLMKEGERRWSRYSLIIE